MILGWETRAVAMSDIEFVFPPEEMQMMSGGGISRSLPEWRREDVREPREW